LNREVVGFPRGSTTTVAVTGAVVAVRALQGVWVMGPPAAASATRWIQVLI